MAHFAGTLDPASIFLHRHGNLPIMHIQAQLQNPDQCLLLSCFIPNSLRYSSVYLIHNADSLAAGAASCRLMTSEAHGLFSFRPLGDKKSKLRDAH
jgi:hypothetical protein